MRQNFRSVTNMLVDGCLDLNYVRWTSRGAEKWPPVARRSSEFRIRGHDNDTETNIRLL
jgi:hypothetical protein